jgi:hypothetical protein
MRGAHAGPPWYDDEIAASARDGVRHFDLGLSPTRELAKRLMAAPKPSPIHCNGGADRSGLASALYEEDRGQADRSGRRSYGDSALDYVFRTARACPPVTGE